MSPAHPSVLVIDDEVQIRRIVRFTLEAAGFRVDEAETAQSGLARAATQQPDGIILDLGLPDQDGTQVLRRLREWSRAPVLVLTVRDTEESTLQAFEAGGDDYLTKPFSSRELVARLKAILRRVQAAPESAVIAFGEIEIDLAARQVRRGGIEVKLTGKEYALLQLLAQHRGRVVTHRQILRELWGPHAVESTHYLRVQMVHLRKKLERDPERPRHLQTDSGIGYRLVET
ncbi:MAG TPA: response regulator [Opitutaceae bacterium]|jgi:two-component system KDP operon response regulator KdpE|nr:response regulator [Opitutaceae bacterium]